ncbi:SusC/RagA family TonB-linked outer membrane protein [Chitinophaga filiformis]|uniref:SusC/RagA family TonB-linked outer membrane protein n=1 Tax=Chitinophaga filiformis TaxID=104663 RepID=A0ABY4I8T8_CHIFI|nr:SusC/RagA family TonB-linked outer membrane protein [Chitinophaga filiformis]UPK71498.1 SusC/RagA family TonB-linked outer membrane protein [Chitinophaga filiformis]
MKRSLFLFAVLSVLCFQFAWAQTKVTVTGVVKDPKGYPIPGVSVSEKGTTNGGVTDMNGTYKLNVNPSGTLVFSFIGYLKKEAAVGNSGSLNISLEEDQKGLQEVVVTALNVKRSTKALGYSMTEVKGEDVALSGQVNPVTSLQGKVAGVNISLGGGGPQSSARVLIRGNNSLGLNNQPLFVVDGVYLENGITGGDQWGNSQDFGNIMKNLNPDDFESVSVLKGGAATALYGSRGQNGVIIITTKKGIARKGLGVTVTHAEMYDKAYKSIDFQNIYGVGDTPADFPKDNNGDPYADENNWAGLSFGPKMLGQRVKDWQGNWTTFSPHPHNLLDLYRTGKYYNTNVAVDGGNEKTTFRLSYSNNYTNGIAPNNNFKRNNFNLRATHKLSSRVSADVSANYGKTNVENPAINGGNENLVFSSVYKMSRNFDTKYWRDKYIDPNGGALQNDPYGMSTTFFALNKYNTTQDEDNFQGRLGLKVDILSWLNLSLNGDVQTNLQQYERKELGRDPGFNGGYYNLTSTTAMQRKLQAILSGHRKLTSDLEMDLSVGAETYRWGYGKYNKAETRGGLKAPGLFYISNSVQDPLATARIIKGVRTDAIYAFANFAFRDQLYLDLTGRNDWNSTLMYADGHGVNNYFYPSASLSWLFSETFHLPEFFTFGKLRASYAGTGAGTDAYTTGIGTYSFISNYTGVGGGTIPRFGFDGNTLGNPNLKNEYTRNFEAGADVRFLNNRLGIDVAVYRKNTFNQIIPLSLPQESGVTSRLINAGNVQNTGIEILLNTVPVKTKDFDWNSTLSFTRNKNIVKEIAEGVNALELPNGYSQGSDVLVIARKGAEYGIMQTKYAYTYYNDPSKPSANGKKVLRSNGRYLRSSDAGLGYVDIGTIQPKFQSSWTNSFRYKNFNLNVLVDAKVGGKYSSATYNYAYSGGALKNTLAGRDKESGGLAWTDANGNAYNDGIIPDGVFAKGVTLTPLNGGAAVDASGMTYQQAYEQGLMRPKHAWDYYYRLGSWGQGIRENAIFTNSWVAVREVTVGYNVPASVYSKLKLNNLRVNLVGRNLFYIYSSLPGGLNPEGLYNNSSASAADYGGVPFVRSMGFNLQASF